MAKIFIGPTPEAGPVLVLDSTIENLKKQNVTLGGDGVHVFELPESMAIALSQFPIMNESEQLAFRIDLVKNSSQYEFSTKKDGEEFIAVLGFLLDATAK